MRIQTSWKTTDLLGNEDGAITVDWVVITGAVIGGALAVISFLADGVNDIDDEVADALIDVGEYVVDGATDGLSN